MAISERKEAEAYKAMMAQEMAHRMKNMLATVQSIVNQSMRGERPPEIMRKSISDRLDALSRSHDVLRGNDFDEASLAALVSKAVEPFNSAGRIELSGPDLRLSHQASTSLALALHELATNAAKYGALSNTSGSVRVTWHIDGDVFHFCWEERDGPPVKRPERSGFGSRLIRMVGMSLRGSADIDYRPTGVVFTTTTSVGSLEPVA